MVMLNESADSLVSVIIVASDCSAGISEKISELLDSLTIINTETILLHSDDETVVSPVLGVIDRVVKIDSQDITSLSSLFAESLKHSKGEVLYFLGLDASPLGNSDAELLYTFHEFPEAVAACSKVVTSDGKILNAGEIINPDGEFCIRGYGEDGMLPQYNYARDISFGSMCSIMYQREALAGFVSTLSDDIAESELFRKFEAYLENSGRKIIYQPLSEVVMNDQVVKTGDQSVCTCDEISDDRSVRRVLVLEHCTPSPDQDAGSVTVFNMMTLLRQMGFHVTFAPEDNFVFDYNYSRALQRIGVEVLSLPYETTVKDYVERTSGRYELALLFRPLVMARHAEMIKELSPTTRIIYHTVDLHFLRMLREAELLASDEIKAAAEDMRKMEIEALENADLSIVHSTAEKEITANLVPHANIHVFPLILNVTGSETGHASRSNLVFVGGYEHPPNVDAAVYFVTEIMPIVREKLPGVKLYLVGSKAPDEVLALESDDVIVTGYVYDLVSLLEGMRVSIAPLRYGAGIKGKIGTAMSVGLPVVATSLAAEGMSLQDGENIIIADGPSALADAIVRLYNDDVLWDSVRENALTFADNAWGGEAAWRYFASILKDVGLPVSRGALPLRLYSVRDQNDLSTVNWGELNPVSVVRSMVQYDNALKQVKFTEIRELENHLVTQNPQGGIELRGWCQVCDAAVDFIVDQEWGGQVIDGLCVPNWRERIECPSCRMNNRQRLMASLIKARLTGKAGSNIYLMEHVTPIYQWCKKELAEHDVIGSEYLGYEYKGGEVVDGIRHEDIEALSFETDSLDLIVSNDVFEHVPNPALAFAETSRVLKPGGEMIATIPFNESSDTTLVRAVLEGGEVRHIEPPVYHGNPVSAEGSLVFTDYGWDLMSTMKTAGFSDAVVEIYVSRKYGHLGGGQIVFHAVK